ncbi:MAG: L,D-transpeptidase [Gemmatimonadaceae bacterium]|nr:L,D-transpeptidase [Gemmatimonadaceae bacterium]
MMIAAQPPALAVEVPGLHGVATPAASVLRIEISQATRTLWIIAGHDTLRTVPIAVASGNALHFAGRRWRFDLPFGTRTVRAKRINPVWTPPDWHYAEAAKTHQLALRALPRKGVRLRDGRRVVVQDSLVGVITEGDPFFNALPVDEHVVFDDVLYIPPLASRNRRLLGALGSYALDMGDGFLLHGTPTAQSIGTATTHGCIRLGDDDLAWVFEQVPIGARVTIR